jgi:hypothetical protein
MKPNYFISIAKNAVSPKGTIHDPVTKLKVKVFDTVTSKFKPQKGEVQYFATSGNKTLAFETQGYQKHRNLLILQMVATYCIYLGWLEARIHATMPY